MNVNRNTSKILKPLLVIATLLTVVSPAYSGIYSIEYSGIYTVEYIHQNKTILPNRIQWNIFNRKKYTVQ